MPKEMVPLYQSTLKADASKRPRGQVVLDHPFFGTQLVIINKELSKMQLLDAGEKEKLFLKLTECLDSLPEVYLRKKLLPELLKAVEVAAPHTSPLSALRPLSQSACAR